jgi:hypothetical protein
MLNSSEDVPYFGLINVRYYVARWSRRRRIDRHRAAYCLRGLGVSRFGLTNLRVLFLAFKIMLQADPVQFEFSPPLRPTLGEFVFALSLWWLIGLTIIVVGAYGLYRSNNGRIRLLALGSLSLGVAACFLLGFSFTPLNHHRFAWSEDDQNINRWINICVVLMTWGTAPLFFWVGRKIGKRGVKGAKPNEN